MVPPLDGKRSPAGKTGGGGVLGARHDCGNRQSTPLRRKISSTGADGQYERCRSGKMSEKNKTTRRRKRRKQTKDRKLKKREGR